MPVFEKFLDEVTFFSSLFAQTLLNSIDFNIKKNKKQINILDLGCGTGFPLFEISEMFNTHAKCFGIDQQKELIEIAQKKMEKQNIKNTKLVVGSILNLETFFENNFFDLCVSNNGVNNTNDTLSVFKKVSSIMKTNGQFVFSMISNRVMIEFYENMKLVVEEMCSKSEVERFLKVFYDGHIDKKRPSKKVVTEWLQKSSFSVKEILEKTAVYRFIDFEALKNHHQISTFFWKSWVKILTDSKLSVDSDVIMKEIEKRMNKIAEKEGFIKLSVCYYNVNCYKVDKK